MIFSENEFIKLYKMLHLSITNDYSELESVFKSEKENQPFTKKDFENVFRRLKSFGLKEVEEPEVLDIRILQDNNYTTNDRINITSLGAIKKYCDTNNIKEIDNKYVNYEKKNRFIKKTSSGTELIKPLKINDYNFKINLNYERKCRQNDIDKIIKDFDKKYKVFRLKKRFSFISEDNLFRFDLTIVRTSQMNSRNNQYIKSRDLKSSGILNNEESYEFELEFIGKEEIKVYDKLEDSINVLIDSLINNAGIILQVLKNTYYLISNSEERQILKEYCQLIYGKKITEDKLYNKQNFIGPKNVSLEKINIVEQNEKNNFNIRQDYCVTDKADGERHLAFIAKDGKIYLINNRLQIRYTGVTSNKYYNSILDGELLTENKNKDKLFKLMIFDLYFIQGQDVRNRQLNRSDTDKENGIQESRLEVLDNLLTNIEFVDKEETNTISFNWKMKDFYYGDIGESGDGRKIFKESKKLIDKIKNGDFEYETDGLIYTPIKLPVGGIVQGVTPNSTGITWNACFKWKPPEDNTIDFLVSILKEKNSKGKYKDKIGYKIENDEYGNKKLIKYKTLILKTGYNPSQYEKMNPIKTLIEGKEYISKRQKYIAKEFVPTDPPDKKVYLAKVLLESNEKGLDRILCYKTQDEIEDNTIVEMSYDILQEEGFRWKPRNVRYDKTMEKRLGYTQFGNDFGTAQAIWSSYHNPITEEMLSTGNNIKLQEYDSDIYYSRVIERGKSQTKPLLDFHNLFVKNKLIQSVSELSGPGLSLIDLACGKAGDLNKWIKADIEFVLGVDISLDNIENSKDGAYTRYYQTIDKYKKMKTEEKIPEVIFSVGDTSKNINNGDCTDIPIYKELLKIIFGNKDINEEKLTIEEKKLWGKAHREYDICSIQFALHYYFKDIDTLRGLLENIKTNVKIGGYLIGTCFDGQSIFDKLTDINKGEFIESYKDQKNIWKIKKDYDNKTFNDDTSSLGISIWVYMETINQMFREYLVNFDFFQNILKEYGFELEDNKILENYDIKSTGLFSELFDNMINQGEKYGSGDKMSQQEKDISFMNRYFIFKKVSDEPIIMKTKKKSKKIIVKK